MSKKNEKAIGSGIEEIKNKDGEILRYKFRCCVGRDERNKQIWKTKTISVDDPRIEGKTPAALRKELLRIKAEWDNEQKETFANSPSALDKNKITFDSFVTMKWWQDHVMDGSHKPTAIQFYKYMSNDLISYFGKKRLRSISGEDIKRYIKFLNNEAVTKKGEPLSATTKQHLFGTLRNILEYARRFHYIDSNPCQDLSQKEKPQREKKKVDFLEPEQAQRFLRALEKEPLFWRCFENILITCGLRRGECLGLEWQDIDEKKLTITIARNVTMDKNSELKYHIGTPKTGEGRTVPISKRLFNMLQDLRREQEKKFDVKFAPTAFIFCSPNNPLKPIFPTEPTRWQRRFVKRHKLPPVSPHDLRHTAASLALEAGANLKEVQMLLGHQDPSTTLAFYAGITEAAERKVIEGIENILTVKQA